MLKQARESYKKNTYFLSATGKIKTPLKITHLIKSELTGDILEVTGGVIYCNETDTWAIHI